MREILSPDPRPLHWLSFAPLALDGMCETLLAANPHPMLAAAAPDGDLRRAVVHAVNPAWATLFDSPVLGSVFPFFHPNCFSPTACARLRAASEAGQPARESVCLTEKSGRTARFEAEFVRCPDGSGAGGRWIVTLYPTDRQERNEDMLREVIASARCILWRADVEDRDGQLHWRITVPDEAAAQRQLPLPVEAGATYFEVWTACRLPEDNTRMDVCAEEALRTGQSRYSQEFRCRLPDGTLCWFSEDVHVQPTGSGRWHLVGICADITERKQAEDALARERNLLRTLLDSLPDMISVSDTHGRFLLGNRAHQQFLGGSEAIVGKTAWDFLPPDRAETLTRTDQTVLSSGLPRADDEECVGDGTGRQFWMTTTKVPLRDARGAVVGLLGISRDITAQKRMEAERTRLLQKTEQLLAEAVARADRDPLTGLLNHRAFHKRLDDEAERARENGTPFAVAVLDLDNFKFFNDSYGHAVGDDVLCMVAQSLRACCRPDDILTRFGGDEFALLLLGVGLEEAAEVALRLSRAIAGMGYQPPGHDHSIPLGLSHGIAVYPDDGLTRLDVLAQADARLLRAKTGSLLEGEILQRLSARLNCSPANFSMLNALVTAVDNKDRYTRRHSEDVLLYSLHIARKLGLDAKCQHTLQVAALLHDVGKIGVPDHILRKPGRLSEAEFQAVRQHPMMGAVIVGAVPGFEETLDAIRHHHERWDGGGYPFGLCGEETPLPARILAVADAYSAMTTDRPYRKGQSRLRALETLQQGAGAQWDPACVAAFVCLQNQAL